MAEAGEIRVPLEVGDVEPIPVAVVRDHDRTLRERERWEVAKVKANRRVGYAFFAAASAPAIGLVCRLVAEWFLLGWRALG